MSETGGVCPGSPEHWFYNLPPEVVAANLARPRGLSDSRGVHVDLLHSADVSSYAVHADSVVGGSLPTDTRIFNLLCARLGLLGHDGYTAPSGSPFAGIVRAAQQEQMTTHDASVASSRTRPAGPSLSTFAQRHTASTVAETNPSSASPTAVEPDTVTIDRTSIPVPVVDSERDRSAPVADREMLSDEHLRLLQEDALRRHEAERAHYGLLVAATDRQPVALWSAITDLGLLQRVIDRLRTLDDGSPVQIPATPGDEAVYADVEEGFLATDGMQLSRPAA